MWRLYLKSLSRTITTLQDKDHLPSAESWELHTTVQRKHFSWCWELAGGGGLVCVWGFRQGQGVNFSCYSGSIWWSHTVGYLWKVWIHRSSILWLYPWLRCHQISVTQVPGQPNTRSKESQIEDQVPPEVVPIRGEAVNAAKPVSHVVWNLGGLTGRAGGAHRHSTGSHNSIKHARSDEASLRLFFMNV